MARLPSKITQGDITRAVKGVVAAGVAVMRVEVDINGRIIVIAGKPPNAAVGDTPENIKKIL
jgi:hypothetical protein